MWRSHSLYSLPRIFLLVTSLACWPSQAEITVRDPAFQACLSSLAAKYGWSNVEQFEEIVCHNKRIQSVAGLAQFSEVKKLSLYKNALKTLDLTGLNQLVHLNVAGNKLAELIIIECSHLQQLYVFHNHLSRLKVAHCPKLMAIKANNNQLSFAAFTALPILKKLYLFNNKLDKVEIAPLKNLVYLDVRQNPMPDDFYDYLDTIDGLTSLHDGNAEDWD